MIKKVTIYINTDMFIKRGHEIEAEYNKAMSDNKVTLSELGMILSRAYGIFLYLLDAIENAIEKGDVEDAITKG